MPGSAERPTWPVRVRRVEGAPLVAVRAWVRGGARAEEIPGQAYLAGRLLAEGTRRCDWHALAERSEARGMVLQAFGGFEAHGVAVDALARDWERAIDDLAELLLEASFPADRTDLLKRQALAELESQADQADALTAREFLALLYDPHPRGRPLQGTPAAIATLEATLAADFHRRALAWGGVITVAGAIDEAAVTRRLEQLRLALPAQAAPPPAPPAPNPAAPARRELRTRASDQAHLLLGHLTVDRAHPDLPALEVLGVVLGSGPGLSGRIPTRVREKEGLAYSASAEAAAGAALDPGRLVCYVGTSPGTVERAERAVREELDRLLADGPRPEEVEDAKSYLLGREPFRRETARQWADLLGLATLAGLPFDDPEWLNARTRSVTPEAVAAAARRHLHPEKLRVTVGLPGATGEAGEAEQTDPT
jgi:zinc protease